MILIKKKNLLYSGFCCVSKPQSEDEKLNKYLELARELRKLWNMKVIVISVVVRNLGTIPMNLEKT